MRSLNRDLHGDLHGRVRQAYEELCTRQTEAMQNPQTSTFEAVSDAWEHWHHISGIEELFFYQKSRVQWLGLGDRNSRFFHKVTQSRHVRNTIRRIVTGDVRILKSPSDIKCAAVDHFEVFLNGIQQAEVRLPQEELREIIDYRCLDADAAVLQAPVQAEEIKEVLFSMPANKAPGPDGYLMEFYKAAWSVLAKDFVTAVQSFFIYGFMPHNINAMILSLVPVRGFLCRIFVSTTERWARLWFRMSLQVIRWKETFY